ncbi:hypothetical protein LA080_000634 [Diaporthe eres]|nr:hypothetical protein LA080_000634 [Diaporthe eres]
MTTNGGQDSRFVDHKEALQGNSHAADTLCEQWIMGLQHVVNLSAPENDFIDTILPAASEIWNLCRLLDTSLDFAAMFGEAAAGLPDVWSLSLAVAEEKKFKLDATATRCACSKATSTEMSTWKTSNPGGYPTR